MRIGSLEISISIRRIREAKYELPINAKDVHLVQLPDKTFCIKYFVWGGRYSKEINKKIKEPKIIAIYPENKNVIVKIEYKV